MIVNINQEVTPLGICPIGQNEMLRRIELCGKTAYKAESNITDLSFSTFFRKIFLSGHHSVIEHSNIVIRLDFENAAEASVVYSSFVVSAMYRMSHFRIFIDKNSVVISGNTRVWADYLIGAVRQFACRFELVELLEEEYPLIFKDPGYREKLTSFYDEFTPNPSATIITTVPVKDISIVYTAEQLRYTKYDIPQYTFKVITDRGITHELVRHRVLAITQESTRYCNYNKKGFQFVDWPIKNDLHTKRYDRFISDSCDLYEDLVLDGNTPQYARNVLPHSLKAEIMITGRISSFMHFISLRRSETAHPAIRPIAEELNKYFIAEGITTNA